MRYFLDAALSVLCVLGFLSACYLLRHLVWDALTCPDGLGEDACLCRGHVHHPACPTRLTPQEI